VSAVIKRPRAVMKRDMLLRKARKLK